MCSVSLLSFSLFVHFVICWLFSHLFLLFFPSLTISPLYFHFYLLFALFYYLLLTAMLLLHKSVVSSQRFYLYNIGKEFVCKSVIRDSCKRRRERSVCFFYIHFVTPNGIMNLCREKYLNSFEWVLKFTSKSGEYNPPVKWHVVWLFGLDKYLKKKMKSALLLAKCLQNGIVINSIDEINGC